MVSDMMADGVAGLNRYLTNPQYADVYTGWLRDEIVRVRNDMLAIGQFLDTSPTRIAESVQEGETEEHYYKQLKEKCSKLEAVYPGMVGAFEADAGVADNDVEISIKLRKD